MLEGFGIHFVPEVTPSTLALLGVIITWWIKGMPERSKVRLDGEAKLRADLFEHITKLEEAHKNCEGELRALRIDHDGLQRQFIAYQLAVAQAIPPTARSSEINKMIENLVAIGEDKHGS